MNEVVIDFGSKTTKAGYTYHSVTEDVPRILLPTAVDMETGVPPTASTSGRNPNLRFPVQAGKIVDFDGIEAIIHHILYDWCGWEMGNEGNLVMTEPILTPRRDREQLCQLVFETFNVGGFFVQDQAVCSLLPANKTNGLVVDIGHAKIDISVVSEGLQLNTSTATRLPFGGELLTHYLDAMLGQRGLELPSLHDVALVKEQAVCVAESEQAYSAAMDAYRNSLPIDSGAAASTSGAQEPTYYKLPDGQEVYVPAAEGLMLGEALFKPSLMGLTGPTATSIAEAAFTVISGLETALKKNAFDNMYLVGCGCAIPGLSARFLHEMRLLATPQTGVSLGTFPDYMPQPITSKFCSFVGVGMMAKVVSHQIHYVTKLDYEEVGPYAIHRKATPC